jgi:hypothetical protein
VNLNRENFVKIIRNVFIIIMIGLVWAVCGFAQGQSGEHAPGRLLVQRAPGVDDALAEQAITMAGAKVHHKIDQINVSVIDVP